MKTGIITKLALVALLSVFVGGCRKQDKPGEAFVVLKSGEVIYMADMEVVCLKPSFKAGFNGWKTEYENKYKSLISEIEAENPTVKAKLKELDDCIADLNAKISGISGDKKKISDSLINGIESERNTLVAEIATRNDVWEDYKHSVKPIDHQRDELLGELEKTAREQKTIAHELIKGVNSQIAELQLSVPRLDPEDEDVFLFQTANQVTYNGEGQREMRPRPSGVGVFFGGVKSPFLLEQTPHNFNGSDWIFLKNVPAELEGSKLESTIKTAYQKWRDLKSRSEKIRADFGDKGTLLDAQLVSWQNRHGFSQWDGQSFVEIKVQQEAKLLRLNDSLNILKAGGVDAHSLLQEEIKKRITIPEESLNSKRKRREEVVKEAVAKSQSELEYKRNNLKAEYRQEFLELIKKYAVTAERAGSKGDFIVSGKAAYVYTENQRDNGEKLAWLVRVDPKSPKIKMSLSNTASAGGYGDFDEFWMMHWNLE